MMRCTCCRRWTVRQVALQREPDGPVRTVLRVCDGVYVAGEFSRPQDAAALLATVGVLAHMVEDE